MLVKIKKLVKNAVIPTYAHASDAGMDLTATSVTFDHQKQNWIYGTGLAFEVPEGFVGLVFPRSSNRRTNSFMTNHVGVLDSGYRGELYLTFKNRDYEDMHKPYEVGEKIGQLIIVPYPKIEWLEVEKLSASDREDKGHGSTGK